MTTPATVVVAPVVPADGALQPLGMDEVRLTEGFWAQRQAVNGKSTLTHIEEWLERAGWLRNFDLAAAGTLPEGRRGREFSDSEVYKYLEGLAWEIGRTDDDDLERRFRASRRPGGRRAGARRLPQHNFGRPGQAPRWSDLERGHELYCVGHLLQAAVARARTRPDGGGGLVEAAIRAADLVCDVFGDDGVPSVCGHPEIELALVELARLTGDQGTWNRQRASCSGGVAASWPTSSSGAILPGRRPVRDAEVLTGHAVRANYLAAGAVDVGVERADGSCCRIRRQWDNTVARRTYITGGQGAQHQDEAFGADWVLPPDRSYSETCAGVASIMFSWRLLLDDGEPRYADLIERTLFNVVATSPSAEGTAFFYAHTLHQRVPGDVPAAGRDVPAGVVVVAVALVRGLLLSAERRPHPCQPGRLRRDPG